MKTLEHYLPRGSQGWQRESKLSRASVQIDATDASVLEENSPQMSTGSCHLRWTFKDSSKLQCRFQLTCRLDLTYMTGLRILNYLERTIMPC